MLEVEEMKALGGAMANAGGDWYEWWTESMGFPRRQSKQQLTIAAIADNIK
jgi:hypothetical protein